MYPAGAENLSETGSGYRYRGRAGGTRPSNIIQLPKTIE